MSTRPTGRVTVIRNGTLIDGTGKEPLTNTDVLVRERKIEAIGRGLAIPSQASVIEATGRFVMPGLIDAHLHLFGSRTNDITEQFLVKEEVRIIRATVDARRLLDAGFTTVRDAGSTAAPAIRDAINEGTVRGPRIIASGKIITQTAGHGDAHYIPLHWMKDIKWVRIADGVDDCRKAAREVLREGSDVVKIMTSGGVYSMRDPPHTAQYTVDEIKAMTEEAHRVDKRVMTHCISAEGAKNSILGGVDTIEHGYLIDDEAIDMMVKHDKVLCPTLAIIDRLVTYGKQLKAPEWAQVKGKEAQAKQIETVKKAHARGVKIAVSTDYGGPKEMPMGANAIELQLLTEKCGFTSMETIVAATKIGAEACGLLDQIGTLEPGKLADLLVLKSDPLKDIRIFQNRGMISLVMKEGRVEANRGLKITRA